MSRISDISARTTAMNDVADALGLSQAPLRIECYDISNTVGGAFQVASRVVFEDGMARTSEYRRFAIRGADGKGAVDDLNALYETLTRRFKHGNIAGDTGESMDNEKRASQEGELESAEQVQQEIVQQNTDRRHFAYKPNLVVVDGGKPQVMAAAKALEDCGVTDVAVCGLAKRMEEVWVLDDDYPVILKRSLRACTCFNVSAMNHIGSPSTTIVRPDARVPSVRHSMRFRESAQRSKNGC